MVAFGDQGLSDKACRDKDAPPEDFPDFLEAEGLSELATICETASCLIFTNCKFLNRLVEMTVWFSGIQKVTIRIFGI